MIVSAPESSLADPRPAEIHRRIKLNLYRAKMNAPSNTSKLGLRPVNAWCLSSGLQRVNVECFDWKIGGHFVHTHFLNSLLSNLLGCASWGSFCGVCFTNAGAYWERRVNTVSHAFIHKTTGGKSTLTCDGDLVSARLSGAEATAAGLPAKAKHTCTHTQQAASARNTLLGGELITNGVRKASNTACREHIKGSE